MSQLNKINGRITQPTPVKAVRMPKSERPGWGKLDQIINATLDDPNNPLRRVANTLMNPGHEGNLAAAIPLPDGTPGLVYLHKSIIRGEIEIPAGDSNTAFRIVAIPSPEYPYSINFANGYNFGIVDPEFCVSGNSTSEPASYFHKMAIYGHRCTGKSITLEQATVANNKCGNITCSQLPALWDNNSPPSIMNYSPSTNTNYRVLQAVPLNSAEASRNFASTNWSANDGAYMPCQFASMDMCYRNLPENKCLPTLPDVPNSANTCDTLNISDFATLTKSVLIPSSNGYNTAVSKYTSSMVGGTVAHGHIDNTQTGCIFVEGLSSTAATQFTFKICIVREFILKPNSPLIRMQIPRPPMNRPYMDLVINYMQSLPGMYPADFNFWNELWTGFKKVIKKASGALPLISPVISSIFPEASGAMSVVDKINKTVNPLITNW